MKKAIRLGLLASLLCAAPALAQVTGDETRWCGNYGEPHADMPPEFEQFAFMIGDYDVGLEDWDAETESWTEAQFYARWNGRYAFGGRAIVDEWYDPGYGYRPQSGAGVNIRIFDEEAELWETAWHYTTSKQVLELHQKVREDGKLWLWQIYPETAERKVYFETYEDGAWARITLLQNEETGEWVNSRRLHAVPADCPVE